MAPGLRKDSVASFIASCDVTWDSFLSHSILRGEPSAHTSMPDIGSDNHVAIRWEGEGDCHVQTAPTNSFEKKKPGADPSFTSQPGCVEEHLFLPDINTEWFSASLNSSGSLKATLASRERKQETVCPLFRESSGFIWRRLLLQGSFSKWNATRSPCD